MKNSIAVILGLFSGLVAYFAFAVFILSRPSAPLYALAALIIVWGASTWWIQKGTAHLSVVFKRGFLLGAAEWVAIIPLAFIVTARNAPSQGSTLGVLTTLTTGFCLAMAFACLIGFVVAYLVGRNRAAPTRP